MKRFLFEFEDEAPQSLSFALNGGESLKIEQQNGEPFLYANKKGCRVLAEIFAKLAVGDYSDGFHLHLQQDFESADGNEVLTILLSE